MTRRRPNVRRAAFLIVPVQPTAGAVQTRFRGFARVDLGLGAT